MRILLGLITGVAVLLASGCGSAGDAGGRLDVVATTTQAADLVRNVGGDRVRVTSLLAANSDPHDYEVRPGDVKALSRAGLVVRSGGDLDGWLQGALDSAGTDAPLLTLSDAAGLEGEDPHWWQDPRRAARAVAAIRGALAEADPARERAYTAAAAAYRTRLRALDAAVARCVNLIAPAQRKLVTTHDALGYYARRYDIQVIGTVIPSLSTQAQPSAGDLSALVDTIRREHVKAVFAESSVNPKVERAIAAETGAVVGRALWADSLGPAGSSGATYLDSIRANTEAIVDGLSGGTRRCELPR